MSLKTTIASALEDTFEILDSLAKTITYHETEDEVNYNTTTGSIGRTDVNVYTDIPAIFVAYAREEVDGQLIRPEDQKCLILRKNLPIETKLDDYLVSGADTYEIVKIRQDPSESLHILQIRRPS